MAPLIPYHVSAGSNPIINLTGQHASIRFGGMLITELIDPPPGRSFCFRQTYRWRLPPELEGNADAVRLQETLNHPSGPPAHFHPFQNEWYRVESGRMCVEIDGVLKTLTPEDGEVFGRAGSIHRFFIAPDSTEDMVAIISASDPGRDYQLDRIFFENWYGIWHDYLVHENGKMDIIQLLCHISPGALYLILATESFTLSGPSVSLKALATSLGPLAYPSGLFFADMNTKSNMQTYDAGDAYLPGPAFLPRSLQRLTGYWAGIVVGRWIGALLGYKPFFKEYTTDWDLAVAKMKSSFLTGLLVDTSYKVALPWSELDKRLGAWDHGGGTGHMPNMPHLVNGEESSKPKQAKQS